MRHPSYIPFVLYDSAIREWVDRIPMADGPILKRWHLVIADRFMSVYTQDEKDDLRALVRFLEDCARQWGPLSLETLVQVARDQAPSQDPPPPPILPPVSPLRLRSPEEVWRESEDEYRLRYVLTALGVTQSEVAREALIPYLVSPKARERWTSAEWLGELREPQAIPVLCRMLTEYWPPKKTFGFAADVNSMVAYYFEQRQFVPHLLSRWGDPQLAIPLRDALIQVVMSEQIDWPPPTEPPATSQIDSEKWRDYYNGLRDWTTYEHCLVYGLGRLGAFDALVGIEMPAGIYGYDSYLTVSSRQWNKESEPSDRYRANLWRVHACCGYLEPDFRIPLSSLQSFPTSFDKMPEFAAGVQSALQEHFGMNKRACKEAMHDYERASCLWPTVKYYQLITKILDYNAQSLTR